MKKKKAPRSMYKLDLQKLKAYSAQMAGNGIGLTGYQAAINLLTEILYIQRGTDKFNLTPEDCTKLIHQGGFK